MNAKTLYRNTEHGITVRLFACLTGDIILITWVAIQAMVSVGGRYNEWEHVKYYFAPLPCHVFDQIERAVLEG